MSNSTNLRDSTTGFQPPADRLYYATRAWVMWVQGLFGSMPRGQLRWSPNETETEILVSAQEPQSTEVTNRRPFIVAERGHASMMGMSRDLTQSMSFGGESKTFTDAFRTTMVFTCVAKEGLQAQNIGYTIFSMIPPFKPTIQKYGRIHAIEHGIQISPETKHGAIMPNTVYPDWRSVRVVVPFQIQDTIRADKTFYNVYRVVNLHMEENS